MPEGLEVELYRRTGEAVVGRTIVDVRVDERCAPGGFPVASVVGCTVTASRRRGKLMILDTDGPSIGLHFGMAGRLIVDRFAPIERLEYGAGRDDPRWDRFVVGFADGGVLRINDPRRWSSVVADPTTDNLGPDLLSLTRKQLRDALARRRAPLKAVLLDQRTVAGLGNMLVDELLWWADLAPTSVAGALTDGQIATLHRTMRRELPRLLARGGSHTGTISPAVRSALPACPRDGTAMQRGTVGGRTTIWCPGHQIVVTSG